MQIKAEEEGLVSINGITLKGQPCQAGPVFWISQEKSSSGRDTMIDCELQEACSINDNDYKSCWYRWSGLLVFAGFFSGISSVDSFRATGPCSHARVPASAVTWSMVGVYEG